jgi:glycosyltransferase domain-containing protein
MTEITSHNNLKKLTIVILTYKRHLYALRNMKYWSNKAVCVRVIDGTDHPIDEKLLEQLDENIIYKHDPRSVEQRLASVVPDLDTEYVVLMGDDEFYLPSAVSATIDELDKDPSLISCCGCSMGFFARDGIVFGREAYPKLVGYNEVMKSSSLERINSHMGNYVPSLMYGVTRVDLWKSAVKLLEKKWFNFFSSVELQFEMYVSFSGKAKVLRELMWLRSYESAPLRHTDPTQGDSFVGISEWWNNPASSKEKEEFIEIMSNGFSHVNNDSDLSCRDHVIKGVESYINQVKNIPKKPLIKRAVRNLSYLPEPLKDFIRWILKGKHVKFYASTLIEEAVVLENKDIKINFNELKEIEKIVLNYHK